MEYKFTAPAENYAPFASGGVFSSAPGHPAFPIRLANELFRRCLAWRKSFGAAGPCVIYDPCCGGAYHLATLAFFNWNSIERIYASDVDADALAVALRNLALLTPVGLERRREQLAELHRQWGKESHATSLHHAQMLKQRLAELSAEHTIATDLFCADATDGAGIAAGLGAAQIDLVLTDIPYGQASQWRFAMPAAVGAREPVQRLLDALLPALAPHAVVAVAAGKGDKIRHAAYRQLEKFNVGKRQIVILRQETE